MTELTLEKFEEAAEIVKKVTLPTNLIYSDFFSRQCGNKVYLKPEEYAAYYVINQKHAGRVDLF